MAPRDGALGLIMLMVALLASSFGQMKHGLGQFLPANLSITVGLPALGYALRMTASARAARLQMRGAEWNSTSLALWR